MATPHQLADAMREQAGWCGRLGSPLYQSLLLHIARNVEDAGICWRILESRTADPHRMKLPLRFLAAVHRLVLEGRTPALERLYPSTGGTGDADAVWPAFLRVLEHHGADIRARLPEPVQYSEVRRCCALLPGFLEVSRQTALPLRLLELGSSAGFNLRWDRYRYETNGTAWGPPDSPIIFRNPYSGDSPQFDLTVTVTERHGCDLNPIDPLSDDGRLTRQSFLWPDQLDRFDRLERAIAVARSTAASVDRAEAVSWLAAQLAHPHPGVATVVFHSIVLIYFSPQDHARVTDIIADAGKKATSNAPLAWLSMEPDGEGQDNVHLTLWPGGIRQPIASAGYQAGQVALAAR